jgi:germacradienol/geosmin synthase
MDPDARALFRESVETMLDSWHWELDNQAQHRVPDPVDYIEMRRATFGADMTMSLARISHGRQIPPEIYRSGPLCSLVNAAVDYATLLNDLFSYQKEIEVEGEVHNMVLVVESFLGLDRLSARDVVVDLMAERMSQFQHLADNDLPALFDELALEPAVRAALTQRADELKDWMSGILEWHRRCERYTEAELRRRMAAAREPLVPAVQPPSLARVSGLSGLSGLSGTLTSST